MHPILFEIGGRPVTAWEVTLHGGFWLAAALAFRHWRKLGHASFPFAQAVVIGFLAAVAGARLGDVLLNPAVYQENPVWIIQFWRPGWAYLPALLAGGFACLAWLRRKGQPVWTFADVWAPALALAQMIARLGCFLAGCCYGIAADSGIVFPSHGEYALPRVPIQLIEAAALAAISVWLWLSFKRRRFEGELFLKFALTYGTLRFVLEFFRGDTPSLGTGPIRTNHLAALVIVLVAAHFWKRLSGRRG